MNSSLALFFGTRPQVIKASVLRQTLAGSSTVIAVDTGQHYDYSLHQVHYDQLGIAPPDVYLGVGSGTHAEQTAAILVAAAQWIESNRPALAMVIGDTNSTLACALAAAKHRVPVVHVEAGLRATDASMAEEINRRCVDAISTLLFAPSRTAESTLRRERPDAVTHWVGDVAYDVLRRALPHVPELNTLNGYQLAWGSQYVYATLHRAELVDDPSLLDHTMNALSALPLPVVFAAHPRTASALKRMGCSIGPRIHLCGPLGYLESVAMLRGASAVVTDSGGIQREAYWMGVPCVTLRNETEWGETVSCGANRLVPPARAEQLESAVGEAVLGRGLFWDRTVYGDGTAAERIAAILSDCESTLASRSA